MAFIGRLNRRSSYVDHERHTEGRSKMIAFAAEDDSEFEVPPSRCSRNYIKTYNMEQSELGSEPSTVRFVGDSASSCELNSMADTEMSTLRCNSPRSLEMETESVMTHSSEGNSMSDPTADDQLQQSLEFEKDQLERGSTTSMCSWEPEEAVSIYEEVPQTELGSQCEEVPQLELGSDTASLYDDHQEPLSQMKILRHSNEAYDNWLSGKKRQFQYKQRAEREQQELQKEKEEDRRQLNEQRVKEWRQRKALENLNAEKRKTFKLSKPSNRYNKDAEMHLHSWEMRKIQDLEERRHMQQCLEYRKQQEQLERKEQAARAWKQWIKGVAQRPKPVPLNQGFQSLRGTISNIYINPNQWVH